MSNYNANNISVREERLMRDFSVEDPRWGMYTPRKGDGVLDETLLRVRKKVRAATFWGRMEKDRQVVAVRVPESRFFTCLLTYEYNREDVIVYSYRIARDSCKWGVSFGNRHSVNTSKNVGRLTKMVSEISAIPLTDATILRKIVGEIRARADRLVNAAKAEVSRSDTTIRRKLSGWELQDNTAELLHHILQEYTTGRLAHLHIPDDNPVLTAYMEHEATIARCKEEEEFLGAREVVYVTQLKNPREGHPGAVMSYFGDVALYFRPVDVDALPPALLPLIHTTNTVCDERGESSVGLIRDLSESVDGLGFIETQYALFVPEAEAQPIISSIITEGRRV